MAAGLEAIEHIVVLMMENRSFDHMLGYLTQAGMDEVNGLKGDESNLDAEGNEYPVFAFGPDETAFHKPNEPLDKSLDPCHGSGCVEAQVAGGKMSGFVTNFIDAKKPPPQWRKLPMGYYTSEHLPVYDHLAREFCVCDAWHSSVPADTWPNRLYAMAGRAGQSVVRDLPFFERLTALPFLEKLKGVPLYEVESFARHLIEEEWRWYSHDPSTLRVADKNYRRFPEFQRGNFAYFNRKKVSLFTEVGEFFLVGDSFLDDAAKGELRAVSWIDPNFIDLSVFDPNSDDDHPPADVRAGQGLMLDLYEALVNSPNWENTLLVITYDEHGGFYDHVSPPAVDDDSGYPTLGVRVPALVVGPRVKQQVCHQQFDHTTLIKTILTRFAPNPEAAIAAMGPRVKDAPDLGVVLRDAPRTDLRDHGSLRDDLERWRIRAREERKGAKKKPSPVADGAGHNIVFNEFQEGFLAASLALRDAGLPAGSP